MKNNTVIIVVDFQADFTECYAGSLRVPDTDADYINQVAAETRTYQKEGFPIIATKDFHPSHHISFYTTHENAKPFDEIKINNRIRKLWPPHCVQRSHGVDIVLPPDIQIKEIIKGFEADKESYSGFFDEYGGSNGLDELLQFLRAKYLIIYGLTIEYCVKETVLHALRLGYEVDVRVDLSRGLNLESSAAAIQKMEQGGAIIHNHTQMPIKRQPFSLIPDGFYSF